MFQMKFHPHQGDETLRAPAQYTTVQKKETHTHRIQTKIQLKLRRGNAISVTTKIYWRSKRPKFESSLLIEPKWIFRAQEFLQSKCFNNTKRTATTPQHVHFQWNYRSHFRVLHGCLPCVGGQQNTRTRQLDSNRKVNIETYRISGGAHILIYGFWFAGNFVIYVCQYAVAAARLAVFAWVVCVLRESWANERNGGWKCDVVNLLFVGIFPWQCAGTHLVSMTSKWNYLWTRRTFVYIYGSYSMGMVVLIRYTLRAYSSIPPVKMLITSMEQHNEIKPCNEFIENE